MTRAAGLLAVLGVAATGCLSFHAEPIADARAEATFLTLRGTPVHFVDEGPRGAPAVVLIHGFASSIGVWTGVREALRERYRVLALDLKGFGRSGRPEGDYSPQEQARLVLALMDARSVHRAALVAHSYGSSVALQVALLAPDRVERVALYDAWVYSDQLPTSFHWARAAGVGEIIFGAFYDQRTEDKIARAFFDPERIPQALVDTVEEQLARPGTRAAALAAVRAMRYERQEARYGEITQPVLLLWGREDAVTTLEFGERLANDLPEAELAVFPRCGHFPMIEARHASTGRLRRFLAAGPGAAPAASAVSATPAARGGEGEGASDTPSQAPATEVVPW